MKIRPDPKLRIKGTSRQAAAAGLWYQVVGTGGSIQAHTLDSPGPDIDTLIDVYTYEMNSCQEERTLIVQGDDIGLGDSYYDRRSLAIWQSQKDVVYHIIVTVYGVSNDEFVLAVF
jgi:hypothetical protein